MLAVHGCRLSAIGFWKNFFFYVACFAALFALGKLDTSTLPSYFPAYLAFGCCLWSTAYWIFREILRAPHLVRQWILVLRGLWKNLHIFYVAVNSNPEAFALHSCRTEKCAQSMLLVAASLSAVRTLEVDIISTSAPFFGSLRQFALRRAAFFGALDDEELFIIENSCQ